MTKKYYILMVLTRWNYFRAGANGMLFWKLSSNFPRRWTQGMAGPNENYQLLEKDPVPLSS